MSHKYNWEGEVLLIAGWHLPHVCLCLGSGSMSQGPLEGMRESSSKSLLSGGKT